MGVDNLNNRDYSEEPIELPDHVRLLLNEYGNKLLSGKIKENEFNVNVQATVDRYGEKFREEIEKCASEILKEFEKQRVDKILNGEPKPLSEVTADDAINLNNLSGKERIELLQGKVAAKEELPISSVPNSPEEEKPKETQEDRIAKGMAEYAKRLKSEEQAQEQTPVFSAPTPPEAKLGEAVLGESKLEGGLQEPQESKEEIPEETHKQKERREALETAAQAVAVAEIALKKAEKRQGKLNKILSEIGAFSRKSKEEKDKENANSGKEVKAAKKQLEEAKKNFSDLSRKYAVEDYAELVDADKAGAKEKAIKTLLDSQSMLYDKRIEAIDNNRSFITRGFKKTLDWYKHLPLKVHLAVTAGIIGISAASAMLPSVIVGGAIVGGRIISGIGAAGTTGSVAEWGLKRRRNKEGLTLEKQLSGGKERLEKESESVDLGEKLLNDDFFNKYNSHLDSNIQSVIQRETRDNNKKMAYSAVMGALVGAGGLEAVFKFAKNSLESRRLAKEIGRIKEAQEELKGVLNSKLESKRIIEETFKQAPKPAIPTPPAATEAIQKGMEKAAEQAAQAGKAATEQIVEKGTQTAGQAVKGGMEAAKESGKTAVNLIETARRGDSVWKMLERKAGEAFGKEWDKLDKIQRIHLTDTLKNKVLEGRSSEFLKVGEKVDLSKVFSDNKLLQNLFSKYQIGGDIVKGSAKYEHIQKVSDVIQNNISGWTSVNRGPLTTGQLAQRVRDLLEGGAKGAMKAGRKAAGKIAEKSYYDAEVGKQFVDESARVLRTGAGKAAEKGAEIFPKIAKDALKSLNQKEVDNLWNFPAENFLKSANPGHVNVEFSDAKGAANFRGMRDFALNLKEHIKPEGNESFWKWIDRARKSANLKSLKNPPKFYNLDKTIEF